MPDDVFRVYALLKHFLCKRDGRRKLGIGAESLAAILGRELDSCLDRMPELGVLSKLADEAWDSIGNLKCDGRDIAAALGVAADLKSSTRASSSAQRSPIEPHGSGRRRLSSASAT